MEIIKKHIVCDGLVFPYTLQIKKVKNIILKVESSGEIVVNVNAYVPQDEIDAFLRCKLQWILKQQKHQIRQQNIQFSDCFTQKSFFYLGKEYALVKVHSNHNRVRFDEKSMYVYYRFDENSCNGTVQKFMRKKAEVLFHDRVVHYHEIMNKYGFPFPKIKLRFMKSRWGSCATRKQTITLNLFLLHYPLTFLDYVVVHELAHFVQPNHSQRFYQIIEHILPKYKEYKNIPQRF
ncbi:MAG: M48 family metallopeptidase [Breznakia sp.]